MPQTTTTHTPADLTRRLAFWIILLLGAGIRLYRVDTPSMWWDEILVPMTSAHSLSYIVDFCRSAEMHPPLFYFFSKIFMGLGVTDFWLRLPSVALGSATLWALYHVGARFTDRDTALTAMAFLAASGLHVLLAREIRPYALEIFLLVWVWFFLTRVMTHWRWSDLAALCAINAALMTLHYFAMHLAFAQGVALALTLIRRPSLDRLAKSAVFCLATLSVALPVLWWFFLPSFGSRSIFTFTQYTRWDVLAFIRDYLELVLHFFDKGWPVLIMSGLGLAGFAVLAARNGPAALAGACLCVVPAFNVWAMGKAAYFSPWHLAYIAPFLGLCAACAVCFVVRPALLRQAAAVCLALALCANIALNHFDRFYQPESYRHIAFITMYKPMAHELSKALSPEDAVVCSQPGYPNGVRWYLDQLDPHNPLRRQSVTPDQSELTLRFISAARDFGVLGRDEQAFLRQAPHADEVRDVKNARMYTYRLRRDPVEILASLPFEGGLKAGLWPFYSRVYRLSDAVYMPWGPDGVVPTRQNSPGVVEYEVENRAGDAPQTLYVNLFYANSGRDNTLGLFYRFDDEPLTPLAGSVGPDRKHQRQAIIRRDKPYKRLLFRLEMRMGDKTALYHGGNLETLAFRDLQVYACSQGDCAATQAKWENENLMSLGRNFAGEGFASRSFISQKLAPQGKENLDDAPAPEMPGWSTFRPADPDRPGLLTVKVKPGDNMVFHPRLGGNTPAITAWTLEPDGTRREVFYLRSAPDLWTPIGARFQLDLPPDASGEKTVLIELKGRYSQLWHKNGDIFF